MYPEEDGNFRNIPEAEAPKPDPKFMAYPPWTLMGQTAKFPFPTCVNGHKSVEHMWVRLTQTLPDRRFQGTLENDPEYAKYLEYGDPVTVRQDQIEALFEPDGMASSPPQVNPSENPSENPSLPLPKKKPRRRR